MDDLLKLAADAGHDISTAEDAIEEGAHDSARDALDRAADRLTGAPCPLAGDVGDRALRRRRVGQGRP